MNKKKIGIAITIVIALGLGFLLFQQIFPGEYVPADDEIVLRIQLDIGEDIGFLVFDYRAEDHESSGGVSNADRSLMKRDCEVIQVWNKWELNTDSDAVRLSVRIRIITEYVDPNFENDYPDDITEYANTVSWEARFGESYDLAITGDRDSGYQVVLCG